MGATNPNPTQGWDGGHCGVVPRSEHDRDDHYGAPCTIGGPNPVALTLALAPTLTLAFWSNNYNCLTLALTLTFMLTLALTLILTLARGGEEAGVPRPAGGQHGIDDGLKGLSLTLTIP